MDSRLIALKLVLDELGVPPEIGTLDDRKRVQKAIYLAQRGAVKLGYRFGWYVRGPYAPALAKDYYALEADLRTCPGDAEAYVLPGPVRERLAKVRPLLQKPDDFPLSPEDWLELIASYDFLREVRGYAQEKCVEVLRTEKPRLAQFCEIAKRVWEASEFGRRRSGANEPQSG